MINRKKIIVIAILIALILIAGYFLIFKKDKKVIDTNENTPVAVVKDIDKQQKIEVPAPTVKEKQQVSARSVATTFVERFGSFSNSSDYLSLKDLAPILTDSMSSWISNSYIPKLKQEHPTQGYYFEVITLAPVVKVPEQTDDTMTLLITTQRKEISEDQTIEYKQDIEVQLIKISDNWLVDGAYWKNKK